MVSIILFWILSFVLGLILIACFVYFLNPYSLIVGKCRNLLELVMLLFKLKFHALTMNGKKWSFVDFFENMVDTKEDIVQFIFIEHDEHISRSGLERHANQIAHWSKDVLKLQQGDTVALMMLNRPDFVAYWLGMAKLGIRTALLNTNITGKPFLHSVILSVQDSSKKILILDNELQSILQNEIQELKSQGVTVIVWDTVVTNTVHSYPTQRPDRALRSQVKESDPFLYIFTSGTTGLPKASKISHTRYYLGSIPLPVVCYLRPGVRMYSCLPLYHSAAGMLGVGAALTSGATLVIRYVLYSLH